MARRRSRAYALQALFRSDITGNPVTASLQALWDGVLDGVGLEEDARPPESDEIEFAQRLALGVESNRESIDVAIEACSTNWKLSRMPLVDRNVLRIAAFELQYCRDIPANVSINEAIELAKTFGTEDSRAFVNGIVDRLARNLQRVPEPRSKKGE